MNLAEALAPHGLEVLGTLAPTPEDALPEGTATLALIGPNGRAFWHIFTASPEYGDGDADPLNRWSTRILESIAAAHGAQALFPFGGPPWHPFIAWALRTGQCHQSPVGLLVHNRHGLFVSFRGALALPESVSLPPATRPCDECGQPCRTTCPVGALTAEGYDVPACKAHVTSPEGAACRSGCLVRRACPVGPHLRLPEQSAFHMQAFLGE
ncbi:MAG: ferredoxin [Pseudomonadota bacterium]